jgi:spermidine synthase
MKRYFLEIIVFLCGAVVMIYEIAGSRVLGPYLGTSIFIWTSLIGIILGSLSLGYWVGGRLADKRPSYSMLAWIILAAALLIGFTTLVERIFLGYLPRFVSGLKWQSVIASVFLFAPASVFLGMVSPYAVRLKIKALQTSGSTVGNLYAISTVGSIAGTFAAGFLLIPLMGTTNILLAITALLAILSMILFITEKRPTITTFPLVLLALSGYNLYAVNTAEKRYTDVDTQYNRVWIYDATDQATGKPIKFMRINNESSSAMFPDSEEPVFPYARYYRLAEHFTPGFRSTLILGGAAYSYPKYFLQRYPDATIDVVEIDPELTELAREHFRLKDNPRMRIYHEDARTFLNRSPEKYDVIYGDAYKSLYTIPWHLTTIEAARKTYDMLNEGGCVLLNIISSIQGDASLFLTAELATYRAVFKHVYVFAVMDPEDLTGVQSTILVAVKSDWEPAFESPDAELADFLSHEVSGEIFTNLPVLTDEYAPVDYYTNKAIK